MGVARCRLADIFHGRIAACIGATGGRADRRSGRTRSASAGHRNVAGDSAAAADQAAAASGAQRPKCGYRSSKPGSHSCGKRCYVRLRFRARQPSARRGQRDSLYRAGIQRAACVAGRRVARNRAGADRDPAFRRGQSQPIFSARLQSRPRHGPRHHRRRHAGQYAHAWPRPRLCRYQLSDSGAGAVRQCPQRALLCR